MAKGSIQINPSELTRLASASRNDISAVGNALRAGTAAIANTANGPWAGQAGDIARSKMSQFTGTHSVLIDRITAWANFLDWAAAQYSETEEMIDADIRRIGEIALVVPAIGAELSTDGSTSGLTGSGDSTQPRRT